MVSQWLPRNHQSWPYSGPKPIENGAPDFPYNHLPGHHIPGCPHAQTFCTEWARDLEDIVVSGSVVRAALTTFTESDKHWLLVAGQVGVWKL